MLKNLAFLALCLSNFACAQNTSPDTPEAFLARLQKGLTRDSPHYLEEKLYVSKTEAQRLYLLGNPDMQWIEQEPENEGGRAHIENFWEENLGPYRRQFSHLWGREGVEGRAFFQKIHFSNIQIDTMIFDHIKPELLAGNGQFGLITADFHSPIDGRACKFQAPVFRFQGARWKLYARFVHFGDCW